jgi:hypothetical protein
METLNIESVNSNIDRTGPAVKQENLLTLKNPIAPVHDKKTYEFWATAGSVLPKESELKGLADNSPLKKLNKDKGLLSREDYLATLWKMEPAIPLAMKRIKNVFDGNDRMAQALFTMIYGTGADAFYKVAAQIKAASHKNLLSALGDPDEQGAFQEMVNEAAPAGSAFGPLYDQRRTAQERHEALVARGYR